MDEGAGVLRSSVDYLNAEAWKLTATQPEEASLLASKASQEALRADYRDGAALACLNLARSAYRLSDLDKAEEHANNALDLFDELEDIAGLSLAFLTLGSVSSERGALDKALGYNMKALELAQSTGRKDREAVALNGVGEVLRDSGETQEALNYFMQAALALGRFETVTDESPYSENLESVLFVNIGQAFIDLGETENAMDYFELAREAAEGSLELHSEILALKGLATALRRQGKREKAQELLNQALRLAEQAEYIPARVEILIETALVYIELDNFSLARDTLNQALELAERHGMLPKIADCYLYRSLSYEAQEDFSAALMDFKRFHDAMESISADRVTKSKKDAEIRFELERSQQEAEIYRLRNVELKEHRVQLERTNDRLKAVAELGRLVTASLDIEAVAHRVHLNLGRLMDASGFSLVLYDEASQQLHYALLVEDGLQRDSFFLPLDSPNSLAAWVICNKQALRMDDAKQEFPNYINASHHIFGPKTASLIYVPLTAGGKIVGAVGVQSVKKGAYSEDDVEILKSLGAFIAVAIENSRSHTELIRLNRELKNERDALERLAGEISLVANHDGLTGLPNRLLLGELLEKALLRAMRNSTILAVLFMDLDDFKPINDRFGHHAGDTALIEVAKRLKADLRASDVVARVGGDEFVAFVADIEDVEAAQVVAEKLISSFDHPILVNGVVCAVGVSIGIALYPKDGCDVDTLLRRADDAMYRIKKNGKNGCMFYQGKARTHRSRKQ